MLIPAYEPGPRLPGLVRDLRAADPDLEVLVVDDGSGPSFEPVFAAVGDAGARVLTHPTTAARARR